MNVSDAVPLACPRTRQPLEAMSLEQARSLSPTGTLTSVGTATVRVSARDSVVLVTADGRCAYPVVDGVPVLMVPETLTPHPDATGPDLADERYREAYSELAHYSATAAEDAEHIRGSRAAEKLDRLLAHLPGAGGTFPAPAELWLDATYELHAQWDAYRHLDVPVARRVLQIGGRGQQAVKFLLAGAQEAWLATPMLGELLYARALAEYAGVADRLRCVAALAEELPFPAGSMDAVYTQGSAHHWVTSLAVPECRRVLCEGGRFAAVEPWRGPLYGLGTAVLGKRDPSVQCVVLTADRIEPPLGVFSSWTISHHGVLSRYPLLALRKVGLEPPRRAIWRLGEADDRVSSRLPALRRRGSSVAVLATA